jgi:hypothetical protein
MESAMIHSQSHETLKGKCLGQRLTLAVQGGLSAIFLTVAVAGCAFDINVRAGRRPDLAALDQRLRLGQSTTDDVLAVLGPPQGKGNAMLPIDLTPRTTWSYSYGQGFVQTGGETRGDMRNLLLFVFLDQGRYEGYLWFSSVPE